MAIINVTGLTKYYGSTIGIRGLDLAVREGEIFGFLGPNGAGKTTTIRLLMQLMKPDGGSVFLFGIPLDEPKVKLRERIGYLSGEFHAYLNMTGSRFMTYLAQYRTRPPKLRSFLIDKFQITGQELKKPIKHLSHGNRQKLGIILALEHDPDLAILDEPTLGLDPLMQESFYDILHMFRDRGKTIFLSSHVLSEVEKVCDRVAIIRNGILVALESIEVLRTKQARRLVLVLDTPSEPPILTGAQLLAHKGRRFEYLVKGGLQEVMRSLADLPLQNVIFPEPDLEDVFMVYYQDSPS
jgi:ABC-2 type transport system ATP-binding protein